MNNRTIVIGDVHGCLDELLQLIQKVSPETTDRVVFVGDLIDRGPDPAGVVAFAHQLGAICVMGNHEEKALRWRKHEQKRKEDPGHYKNPMRSINETRLAQWAAIPDEHWDWIAGWPQFYHINDKWTVVHAGCMPDVPIEHQDPNVLMRLRYVKTVLTKPHGYPKYKMAPLDSSGEPGPDVQHWTWLWTGPRSIIYGHYVYESIQITSGYTSAGCGAVGIDTGCVYGGELTALILNGSPLNLEAEAVKAKRVYSQNKSWDQIED